MNQKNISKIYLNNILDVFSGYKTIGEKALSRVNEKQIHWRHDECSNSLSIIVKHLSGNMVSRWTDFLTSDGEKNWRNRDSEFEADHFSKKELLKTWELGWNCLFSAINSLKEKDLGKIVFIRKESLTVIEAINRQLSHYSYHIGQMVYIAKMVNSDHWKSLSIPMGKSEYYNQQKIISVLILIPHFQLIRILFFEIL